MRLPFIVSYVLLGIFILLSLIARNAEFVIYAFVLVPVVALLHLTDKTFSYRKIALWGFIVWMVLHIAGGLASIGDVRLYDFMLFEIFGEPYNFLKYDQFLHFYCYVVIAMLLGSVVEHVTKKDASRFTIGIVLVLAATGVGAINEIIEFLPVILFDSPGPGGYTNTAIDIVMNFLGSIAGASWYLRR